MRLTEDPAGLPYKLASRPVNTSCRAGENVYSVAFHCFPKQKEEKDEKKLAS
jgi:hypothetical protein